MNKKHKHEWAAIEVTPVIVLGIDNIVQDPDSDTVVAYGCNGCGEALSADTIDTACVGHGGVNDMVRMPTTPSLSALGEEYEGYSGL